MALRNLDKKQGVHDNILVPLIVYGGIKNETMHGH